MKYIKSFEDLRIEDVSQVGGKNASIGEMISNLSSENIRVPSGFAITADAYRLFLESNDLTNKIQELLSGLDKSHIEGLQKIGSEIRSLITSGAIPEELSTEIKQAYKDFCTKHDNPTVAVRSSATAEDLPTASFAGQQESYLNVKGEEALLDACKNAFASLFTDRAISYRIDHDFDHMDVALSVGVQKMVLSGGAASGVMFTLDTESGFKDVVFINSSYGIGESIVKGLVNPDEVYVYKPLLEEGFTPILKKRLGNKQSKIIYAGDNKLDTVDVPKEDQMRFSISDEEILELAKSAIVIEKHYSDKKGSWAPMDIEWAKDSEDGKLYIVQARPETVHSRKEGLVLEEYVMQEKGHTICQGRAVGRKIASGVARVIASSKDIESLKENEILVTDMTDPDWEPVMKTAVGIITNRGGRTCHAAIVSRELGIPAIVGTNNATIEIKNGQPITIDCSHGEFGLVHDGELKFEVRKTVLKDIKEPKAKIMMNVGSPDGAFSFSMLPNSGVGLARLEFIINNAIRIHPMALVHPEKVQDKDVSEKINILTCEYDDKKQFFIDTLAAEVGTIAAAFYPKPVVVRLSDFKSNEYKMLLGGEAFEPEEENPMLGFRGASRYYNEMFREAFELECKALLKVRNEMGLKNIKIMVPFVRTVQEGKTVIELMEQYGIKKGDDGLEVIMMCEVPSNVLLIEQFSEIFDGFSIGSNDLTQLTLAVDRDSELVAEVFDERNEAVKLMMKMAIDGAKKKGKPIGICGQAPSDYPEIAKFLIECGIDSISLNPDTVISAYRDLSQS